jgi:hypothetical protein
MYVTVENAGASPLMANRTSIGTWEQFDLITAGESRPRHASARTNGAGTVPAPLPG